MCYAVEEYLILAEREVTTVYEAHIFRFTGHQAAVRAQNAIAKRSRAGFNALPAMYRGSRRQPIKLQSVEDGLKKSSASAPAAAESRKAATTADAADHQQGDDFGYLITALKSVGHNGPASQQPQFAEDDVLDSKSAAPAQARMLKDTDSLVLDLDDRAAEAAAESDARPPPPDYADEDHITLTTPQSRLATGVRGDTHYLDVKPPPANQYLDVKPPANHYFDVQPPVERSEDEAEAVSAASALNRGDSRRQSLISMIPMFSASASQAKAPVMTTAAVKQEAGASGQHVTTGGDDGNDGDSHESQAAASATALAAPPAFADQVSSVDEDHGDMEPRGNDNYGSPAPPDEFADLAFAANPDNFHQDLLTQESLAAETMLRMLYAQDDEADE